VSLIIARQSGPHLLILGDTHLTDPVRNGPCNLQGIIKTRIFKDTLCVSFAGRLDWAEIAFQELSSCSPDDLTADRVAELLERIHGQSSRSTDFLVATARPEPKLIEVKNGRALEVVTSWLGSAPAFERFQGFSTGALTPIPRPANTAAMDALRLPEGKPSEPNPEYGRLFTALRMVIEDASLPEVGGFVVPVGLHHGRFEYMDYGSILTHPIRFDLLPEEYVTLPAGTAAQGGYSFGFMGDQRSSVHGLAIYILQGRYGVTFTPHEGLLRPSAFRDTSSLDFEDAVTAQVGLEIRSLCTLPGDYYLRAMGLVAAGHLDLALQEGERAVARFPKEPAAYETRGILRAARGEFSHALGDFEALLRIDRSQPGAWDNHGTMLLRLGRYREAVSSFSEAIRLSPGYVRGYHRRAIAARQLGDFEQATADKKMLSSLPQ
jgi:hypothetical protein